MIWDDHECAICGDPFTEDEWQDRHSPEEGEAHAECCPVCNTRDLEVYVVVYRAVTVDGRGNVVGVGDLAVCAEDPCVWPEGDVFDVTAEEWTTVPSFEVYDPALEAVGQAIDDWNAAQRRRS